MNVAEVPGDGVQLSRGEQATATVAELVAWTDSRWASVSQQWAVPAQGLCRCRWLLLGLVLFGQVRYARAAQRSGAPSKLVHAVPACNTTRTAARGARVRRTPGSPV